MKVALGIAGAAVALLLGVWGVKKLTGTPIKSRAAVVQKPGQGGTPLIGNALPGTAGTSADVANYSAAGANAAVAASQIASWFKSSGGADQGAPQPEVDTSDPDLWDTDGTEPTDDWLSTGDDYDTLGAGGDYFGGGDYT